MPSLLLILLIAGIGAFHLVLAGVVFQLMRQRGRILVRLDTLERRFGEDDLRAPDGMQAKRGRPFGERPLSESRIERNGIKRGSTAPIFELPDIRGGSVKLEDFRGRNTLLVFTSPHCSPCDILLSQISGFHREHSNNGLSVVMIGRGDITENRIKAESFGIQFPVAVQKRWEISKEYGIFSTPVAFLVDESGKIARNVAKGAHEIMVLANEGLAQTTGKV